MWRPGDIGIASVRALHFGEIRCAFGNLRLRKNFADALLAESATRLGGLLGASWGERHDYFGTDALRHAPIFDRAGRAWHERSNPKAMLPTMPIYGFSSFVSVSASLSDPAGANVLVAAVSWLERTVLGTIATTIAIIAVSFIGLRMLSGRTSIRQGVFVVMGCFVLFGAPAIVAGIQSFVGGGDMRAASYRPEPDVPAPPPPPPAVSDPYAGASVPRR